mmetsp:Transcript_12833/g.41121  ORF Transcript_12833/g.41121 Transcript_12833/m.41121 type:complete len:292 (-) Transcript_12833:629-1504(-)
MVAVWPTSTASRVRNVVTSRKKTSASSRGSPSITAKLPASSWLTIGLGWRAADHAGVGGRHVGGGGVSSGRRGRGVCARRHRRRRHPCRAQVGEVGREPGELGAGEAVLPQCRVDAARVAGQVAQHRAEAAKGDWALHGGRVADREDAVESGFEGRVGAVGRRLRQPKRMRLAAALVGWQAGPVLLHQLEEPWHLLGRPQVGEEVGGALLLAARRREGLPKELRPRTPPRPAVLRVVLGDEEVASAAQLPRPRAASAAPHLHAHAVGPLASPRLQRERAPVAHRVDDEPAV